MAEGRLEGAGPSLSAERAGERRRWAAPKSFLWVRSESDREEYAFHSTVGASGHEHVTMISVGDKAEEGFYEHTQRRPVSALNSVVGSNSFPFALRCVRILSE